ncbi:ATP-binding cassette domain-containing protein [Streptomyces sp. NPDC005963]|uniref:ATP-binding cassette domain-containing protein n=1 Tax=Streptomyces sp. NPDC005963 TaxID=3156721 RepID=UPI0033C5D226
MDGPRGARISAEGLGLKGPRGWAFRAVDLQAEPGSLIAVEGPSGSGRTCLLLALSGRMRTTEGSAEVDGLPLPRKMAAVRAISALGHVPGVNELDPALTVAEHLSERALMQRRFAGSLPELTRNLLLSRTDRRADARRRIDEALETAGLAVAELPRGVRTPVREVERLGALRLSIALALIGRPRLLAIDDTDLKLSAVDRRAAWSALRSVAASGTTVLAVSSQAPPYATTVQTTTSNAPAPHPGGPHPDGPAAGRDGSTDRGDDDAGTPGDTASGKNERHTRRGTADALAEAGRA